MAKNVVTNIESKTKATKHLSLKSLFFIFGYLIVCYMFKDYVSSLLFIPYMIFSACCCIFLVLPSYYNKGRNHLESILIMLKADSVVYRPYIENEKREADQDEGDD